MITLREIPFDFEPEIIEDVLITGLWFDQQYQAKSLIEETEAYCQELIEQTRKDIAEMEKKAKTEHEARLAQILEEMESNFLDKSEGLFAEWLSQREREADEITDRARKLVESVFLAILNQLPDEDKLHAVFRQIMRAADKRTQATLYFHPDNEAELTEWLSDIHQVMWTLSPDDQMKTDELVLKTEKGELSLSWRGFQQHLVSRLM
ncbi:HrpE/YscL family type III secretion apparatus protein [Pantoea sp. ICBG 1758]|uniref:type III secretion system stator protein SctL n=1 Tax=Pantoea sp. ICBG 1758 TaxID=2071682 RepID=UPI000CE357A2|nr:type III secretion system stator protein SctL [Pantoea sp. ICBG 1758]PPC63865.1 HrpE/YscL family type III secretion apparatus protein [Pantoea sp. ICBG 1758]